MKRTFHKALSMLLTAAMVLNMGIIPVFAQGVASGTPMGASGLTDCHMEHDEKCGYNEVVTVTSPCTHSCEVCKPSDNGKPAEQVCTCPPVDGAELIHGETCPLYTVPEMSAELAAPIALECICPLEGGSTIHTESACPFYGLEVPISKGRSLGTVPTGVTVTQTAQYVYNIYANGNPIIIKQGPTSNAYGFIYIDANNNGEVDVDEPPVELDSVYQAPGSPEAGYFMQNASIYGGCESADLEGDTSVTMSSGLVRILFGGGLNGNVKGTVTVNMTGNGGQVVNVLGASFGNTGDVNLNFSGDAFVQNVVFGGANNGGTVGNTNITLTGDAWLRYVYGGAENGTTKDTNITVSGNSGAQNIFGGGNGSNASAVALVWIALLLTVRLT